MSGFLIFAGMAGIVVGLVAALKGSLPRFHLASRKQAGLVMVAGFVAMMIGGAVAGPLREDSSDPEATSSPSPTASASTSASASPEFSLSPEAPTRPASVPAEAQEATVVRHVDGDTIWAEGGTLPPAAVSKVRFLEVDTPESTNQTDCFGREAAEFTKAELPIGSTIFLLADRGDKDRFDRFLRYVWKSNGEFFNDKLARQGFAKSVLIAPNDRFIGVIRAAEAEAKAARRGLWAACAIVAPPAPPPAPAPVPRPAPAPVPVPRPAPAPAPPAGGGCHPSYSGVCVPIDSDVDCPGGSGNGPSYAPGRNFNVVGPDVYGLDSDSDGVACEG